MNAMPYISHRLFAAAANREEREQESDTGFQPAAAPSQRVPFERNAVGPTEIPCELVELELVETLPLTQPRPVRPARPQS